VKWYGKYGRKIRWRVKRYKKIWKKSRLNSENMENAEEK
jgi:hypothetical protein